METDRAAHQDAALGPARGFPPGQDVHQHALPRRFDAHDSCHRSGLQKRREVANSQSRAASQTLVRRSYRPECPLRDVNPNGANIVTAVVGKHCSGNCSTPFLLSARGRRLFGVHHTGVKYA